MPLFGPLIRLTLEQAPQRKGEAALIAEVVLPRRKQVAWEFFPWIELTESVFSVGDVRDLCVDVADFVFFLEPGRTGEKVNGDLSSCRKNRVSHDELFIPAFAFVKSVLNGAVLLDRLRGVQHLRQDKQANGRHNEQEVEEMFRRIAEEV